MSLSDPIGDMLVRIKNAIARNYKKVELPSSNFKVKIADILKNEGFIKDFKITEEAKKVVEDYTKNGTELSGSITQVHYDSPILKKKLDKDKNN